VAAAVLEIAIEVIICRADGPIRMKFGRPIQKDMHADMAMTLQWSKSTPVGCNMAAVFFQKPEVVISRPWIEICCRNLLCMTLLNDGCDQFQNRK